MKSLSALPPKFRFATFKLLNFSVRFSFYCQFKTHNKEVQFYDTFLVSWHVKYRKVIKTNVCKG